MPPKTKQTKSAQTKCKTSPGTRRSSRLSGVDPISYKEDSASVDEGPNLGPSNTSNKKSKKNPEETSLPRARETSLLKAQKHSHILGIDEAGRGPLAGPVVTAACYFPPSSPLIPGIGDSKTITDESERERLYEQIVSFPGVRYCVTIIDSHRIDEINILQATCEGMRSSARGLIQGSSSVPPSSDRLGCYSSGQTSGKLKAEECYALVDGNRYPSYRGNEDKKVTKGKQDMICSGEAMIKGDGREYVIAAASILAKVTRDRIMREYDEKWPEYGLGKHKGYPTKMHQEAIYEYGVKEIHRRTFAPIKNWKINKDGSIKK
ncbi:hypothetical protein TrST_g1454 [Triparma strigata]|uniref:Ribonuclease n=1 Tax=Triparma strigata TaxID=1606541 RepID=A0A9W7DQN6_9STRA|nr:hypothetical protein TrST_g1454 [Triparma strigata]